MSRSFAFHHRWTLPAAPGAVLDRLADLEAYPDWWPQVRRVERLDGESATVTIRALLPVPLRLVLTREVEDRAEGRLRVAMTGDLQGYADVHVRAVPAGSLVDWDQVVLVTQPVLRRLTGVPPARWALRANHALMMGSARRALARGA